MKKAGRPKIKNNPKKKRMIYISDEAYKFYLTKGKTHSQGIENVAMNGINNKNAS